MGLMQQYLTSTKKVEEFFNTITSAKAPERFTTRFLLQLEFTTASDRLFIGILKGLGLLDENGAPTARYYAYLDQTQSGIVLAEAIREAYSDLFAINTRANELSVDEAKNKFRALTQGQKTDDVLTKMANTFTALCALGDWSTQSPPVSPSQPVIPTPPEGSLPLKDKEHEPGGPRPPLPRLPFVSAGLHYNIQIHLPESRDPAVYDALFRALREHLC